MPTDRLEQSGLNRAWIDAAAALPLEWRIEDVVCTSTGLRPEQRSDRWRAWATGPNGQPNRVRARRSVSATPAPTTTAQRTGTAKSEAAWPVSVA